MFSTPASSVSTIHLFNPIIIRHVQTSEMLIESLSLIFTTWAFPYRVYLQMCRIKAGGCVFDVQYEQYIWHIVVSYLLTFHSTHQWNIPEHLYTTVRSESHFTSYSTFYTNDYIQIQLFKIINKDFIHKTIH